MVDLVLPKDLEEETKPSLVLPDDLESLQIADEPEPINEPTGVSVGKIGAALGTEIAIAEGGRQAASLFGPIGYILGGLAAGAAGSIAAQKITNPDDISEGRVIADAFINLIPGLKAVKNRSVLADVAIRQAPLGAAIGVTGQVGEKIIDEGRLPTQEELATAGLFGAGIGGALGLSAAGVNKLLRDYGGSPAEQVSKIIREGKDENLSQFYNRLKNRSEQDLTQAEKFRKDTLLRIRENYTDENIIQRQLQKESGQGQYTNKDGILELNQYKTPDDKIVTRDMQDYYQTKRLSEGRIEGKLSEIVEEHDFVFNELNATAAKLKNGNTAESLSKSIDGYLHAKYAVDYNRLKGKDGAAGMTTSAAKDYIQRFEQKNLHKELATPIKLLKDQVERTSQAAVDGGLISQKTLDGWKDKYGDNYVPLQRLLDEDLQLKSQTPGSALPPGEVRFRGIYDEVGSDLEVRSIRENIYRQYANIVRRAEINKANLAFVRLINNPQNKEAASGLVENIQGTKFGTADKVQKPPQDAALTYLKNGEKYYLKFKDPVIANAFRGRPQAEMSSIVKTIFNFSSAFNRRLGALYTRFNPDFVIPNLFRDRTEAAMNNTVRLSAKEGLSTLNPYKAIKDDMGIIKRKILNQPARSTQERELYKLFDEFKEDGGSVGGLAGTTQRELIDEVEDLTSNLGKSNPKTLANKLGNFFNKTNRIFEDSTRFATYKLARQSGKSREAAALAARDSSFDPRLGGRKKDLIRATFLFANPALQANKVFIKNLFKNPKKAMGFFGTLMAVKMSLDTWNSSIDPDWEEKMRTTTGSNFITNKSLVFVTGTNEDGTLSYKSMPIGYSMTPFAVAADYAQKAAVGKETAQTFSEKSANIRSEIFETYSPVGRSIVPTPLSPIFDLMSNEDGLGRTIRPEWLESKNMAASEKMYPWTMDTFGGELAFGLAESANAFGLNTSPEDIKYLARTFTGGPGRTLDGIINVVSDLKNGRPVKKSEIPIARRFLGDGYKDTFEARAGVSSDIEELSAIDNTERARESRITSRIFRQYKSAVDNNKPQEALDVLTNALQSGEINQTILKKLERRFEQDKLGLTAAERRLKQISIPRRGQFMINQMKNMSPDEIRNYLRDMTAKKILTKNVMKDLNFQANFRQIQERLQ